MTEAYEDDWLVRVRAQVMCRDEGTGGWVPLGGGGLSNVMVRKRPTHSLGTLESLLCETSRPARPHHRHTPSSASQQLTTTTAKGHHYKQLGGSGGQLEMAGQRGCALDSSSDTVTDRGAPLKFEYFIYGKRISDQSVVLSCTIKKDFQYNKVMPTFHHWLTDEKRFGLTFQTAADARAFDRGVRTAIEDLLDGLGGAWPSLHAYKKHNPAPKDDEDDNIFECLNLPSDSRSSSENSTASRPSHQRHQQPGGQPPQPRRPGTQQSAPGAAVFHLDVRQPNLYTDTMSLSASARELLLKKKLAGSCSEEPPMFVGDPLNADNYSYVQLTQVHEYVYPSLGTGLVTVSSDRSPSQGGLQRRDSGSSLKKRAQGSLYTESYRPTLAGAKRERDMAKKPLPIMEGFHSRLKCRHCQEWYMESSNKPGSCEYAPDCFKSCINAATCIRCAQCMQYHCMADAEGEFATHPCSCNSNDEGCGRRWLSLALLSILVPCLWCYPPLKAVHWCCVGCGVSGGRHTPVQRSLHAYPHH